MQTLRVVGLAQRVNPTILRPGISGRACVSRKVVSAVKSKIKGGVKMCGGCCGCGTKTTKETKKGGKKK